MCVCVCPPQLMLVLRATEQEIQQRTKAAESGWSALTVADLQTTSEGTLCTALCNILDSHTLSLNTIHIHNSNSPGWDTLTYCKALNIGLPLILVNLVHDIILPK